MTSVDTITSEASNYSFRTKTGICTITPEQIILSRESILGTAAKNIHGNNIRRSLTLYALLGITAVGLAAWAIVSRDYFFGAFLLIIGLFLLWSVLSSRNNSAAPIIQRSDIKSVKARAPIPPIRRGYFIVRFTENGKEHNRLIMLPGSLYGGKAEFELALQTMQKSGLMTGSGTSST